MLAKAIEEGVPGWQGVVAKDEVSLQALVEGWLSSLFFREFSPVQSVKERERQTDRAPTNRGGMALLALLP